MAKRLGEIQQKVLILLLGGLALALTKSPKQYFKIVKQIGKEWKEIERRALKRAIRSLYESKLIEQRYNKNGSVAIVLTSEGENKALTYKLDELEIKKPQRWDRKWRLVLFDIPEEIKGIRDALRFHLKRLKFYEFQKSVFLHPYNCKDEVNYLIEFHNISKFVRFIIADSIDNELDIREHFGLK